MSKNLTRKGFALGALVALASSLFAGSPALAADSVVFAADSTDKTLATTIDGTLTLNASLAPGSTAANIAQLKYKIVTDGTFTVRAGVTSGNSRNNVYSTVSGTTGVAKDLWNASAAATSTSDAQRTTYVTPGTTPTATYKNTLAISVDAVRGTDGLGRNPISTDATRTATVTAFIDSNLNSLLDTGEAAQEITVSFIKYSAVTNSATVTSAIEGDTSVSVSYKFTNINNEQLTAANAGVYLTNGVDADLVSGTAVVATGATYSTTADAFRYIAVVDALAKSSSVKVQVLLGSATISGYGNTQKTDGRLKAVYSGTATTAGVTNRALSSLKGNTVASTTASAASAEATSVTQNVALNSEKQVYFIAKDNATTPAAKAGQVVKITVTAASLSATKTLTVNGTTYTDSTKLPGATGVDALSLTTDAAGKVTVTYKTVGFATAGTVKFSAAAENFSADVTGTETTLEYATRTYISNSYSSKATAATFVTTDGKAVDLNVVVIDQFGGAAPDATFQVSATATSQGQATAGTATAGNTYKDVVGGKTTLSILDGGTGIGTNVYTVALQPVSANGNLGTSVKDITVTIKVVSAADAAAGEVALTTASTSESATVAGSWSFATGVSGASDATVPLTYADFKTVDLRNVVGTAFKGTDFAGLSTDGFNLAGTVKSATTATYAGVVVPNSVVTVSGTGLQFAVTEDSVRRFSTDSITIYANANGAWAVDVWSHLAGKQVVTVKSGTGSAAISVYFSAASIYSASTVTAVVADGAAQFQAGRALDVTFKVTDKFGNVVATPASGLGSLSIDSTGAGYLAKTGVVQTSATTGAVSTKLITNAGDLGTATITATLDLTTDVVRTVSSEFGVTDADVTVGGRAVYASVEFAKGKTVTVSVDGRRLYSKLLSTDAYTELKFTQKTAGKHVVTVRVSGGIVYSETVVTTK